jgi:CDP-diacylglycerol--glycerol-3-phosphate 3-phosphatidyltransferase
MNLPNQLTTARLILTVVLVAVASLKDLPNRFTIALVLFLIASLTDFLDGYIARARDLVTDFGKLMDPLADKILTGSVFILLSAEGIIPAWVTILIISREFLVTGLRLIASAQGKVLAADNLGKWKTTFQIIAAAYFLAILASGEPLLEPIANAVSALPIEAIGYILLTACAALTVISGLSYALKNRALIRNL